MSEQFRYLDDYQVGQDGVTVTRTVTEVDIVNFACVTEDYSLAHMDRHAMADSIYKVIELVGTSDKSWEDAARNAVETAAKSVKNLLVAEINKLDMTVENGKVTAFRARVSLSFKYET